VGLLTFKLAGCEREMSPASARAERIPLQVLSKVQCTGLEALAETLVPGSVAAGVAHYVDHQLAASHADCMLMIKYLGVDPPFTGLYQDGLAALDKLSRREASTSFAALSPTAKTTLALKMASGDVADWDGPPPGFFTFVLRSDAVDVRYGSPDGFADLGIPYMAHIEPASLWDEQD
jgi:hypothetical protein